MISYKPGTTLFHRMDPLTKFVWPIVVAFWLYSLVDIKNVIYVSLAVTLLSILGAKLPLRKYLKISLLIFFGGIFLTIYQGIFRAGEGIQMGPLTLSYVGINIGVAIALRTFGLVASSLAFSTTTSPQNMELMLLRIKIPYRIAHIGYLSLRLLPIFERDYQNLEDVQKLRKVKKGMEGFRISVIAFIATELRQADNIAMALETRGFGKYPERTQLEKIEISKKGVVLVAMTTILMLVNLLII